jgi:hypothetical protein
MIILDRCLFVVNITPMFLHWGFLFTIHFRHFPQHGTAGEFSGA